MLLFLKQLILKVRRYKIIIDVKCVCVCVCVCVCSQTKVYSDTFTFLTLSQFIHYNLEHGNKIWQELRVKTVSETNSAW